MYTFLGTLFNLFLTIPAAYTLSKRNLRFRGALSTFFVFTMFFSGGLIPTYLIVKEVGLLNKAYTMIFLGGISIYNLVVARTYFQASIPDTLYEAAQIDGCSDFGQFFKIAIPLAKPIIAVIALYYAVARWNDYFTALIYVTDSEYQPLQMVLRDILVVSKNAIKAIENMPTMGEEARAHMAKMQYLAESMKYSVIFIASLPMLLIYPFIQKYFVKGVMVGSIKG